MRNSRPRLPAELREIIPAMPAASIRPRTLPLAASATAVEHQSSADDARALTTTAGVVAGDPEALADLYAWWRPMMLAWARRATHRDDDFCHDVVHDAFLKIIHRAEPINSAATLGAWLRVIVLRTARDTIRTEKRRTKRDAGARPTSSAAHPDSAIERTETLRKIDAELAALTREHRELLEARFRFGWTLHHTARVMGVKPGLVDGRIRRSLASIRANLESSGGDL